MSKLVLLNFVILIFLFKTSYDILNSKSDTGNLSPVEYENLLEDSDCEIKDVVRLHHKISNKLDVLRRSLFFKIFKVNIDGECNFWTQNLICNYHTCSVCQCSENDIPVPWKMDSENDLLNKNIGEKFHRWVEKYNYSSPEWLVENENDVKSWVYVDLFKNPEAFTGFQGQKIWKAIYLENCLTDNPNQCQEDRLLFKIISGLHANINIHLSVNYLDIEKNLTLKNISMFHERVGVFPERINNMFYLYKLLLRSFLKIENIAMNFKYYTGNHNEDSITNETIRSIYNIVNQDSQCFERSENSNILSLISDKKLFQLKNKFRNISEIIDCVGCQKCKLHGKLQIYGLATMMKILLANKNQINDISFLKRNELISFINLVAKVSRAVESFFEFSVEIKNNNKYRFHKKIVIGVLSLFFILVMNIIYIKYGYKDDLKNAKINKFIEKQQKIWDGKVEQQEEEEEPKEKKDK